MTAAGGWSKRFFDVALSSILLLLSLPLWLAVAVAVKLSSPGPVLYAGERVGRNGRPFKMFKFRSMRLNADRQGPGITAADDPRITRVGGILRATKIDELPQLLNVLRGDMSLVGPRPEAPEWVELYDDQQRAVLSVRPGITGPTQLDYVDEAQLLQHANVDEQYRAILPLKLESDLRYVQTRSFWGDVRLLAVTVLRPIWRMLQMHRLRGSIRRVIIARVRLHGWTFARDACVVVGAYLIAMAMRFDSTIPAKEMRHLLAFLPLVILVYSVSSYVFHIHRRVWKYAGIRDVRALIDSSLWSMFVVGVVDLVAPHPRPVPISVAVGAGIFALTGFLLVRLWPRLFQGHRSSREFARVLIVGAGHGGQLVAADLLGNPQWHRHPVGFLDDDPHLSRKSIHGISVLGTIDDLPRIVPEFEVDIVAVAIPSASVHEVERILAIARDTDARIQILPSPAEVMMGDSSMRLRDINLDDLLDRVPDRAALERPEVQSTLRDKVILVTGARGSIGFELCRQLLSLTPARVVALDNNETGLFYLKRELSHDPNKALLSLVLGDVTDEHKMERIFRRYKPDVVFHAAAYKHVGMLEDHPEEAVFTNVIGTLNLCRAAARNECERFVFISTDKAVQPANVLGFSKRIGEFVVRAHQDTETVFCAVRFGNVVGSRGSALPEFIHQIDAGGPVKVTHPDVERYFMTIPEAVSLVIQAGAFARGGELFMLDMGEPIKIRDLAERIIRLRGLRVGKDVHLEYTGLQPGEKLSEEIMFDAERTQPTSNPAVFAVEDAEVPDLVYLEHSIAILAEVATQSDSLAIRSMLERLATDHFFRRSSHLKTVG